MTAFTPFQSLVGGGLIGLAAVLLMAFHGRIMGISGILGALLTPSTKDWEWRLAFIVGAIAAPALMVMAGGMEVSFDAHVPSLWLVIGGLIVGIGITYGSGCTSGHGICGNARFSKRSIIATITFMVAAIVTVYVIRHLIGGF